MLAKRLRGWVLAITGLLLGAATGAADPITYMQGTVPNYSLTSTVQNGVSNVTIEFGTPGTLNGAGVSSPFTINLPKINLTNSTALVAASGGSPALGYLPVPEGITVAERADGSASFSLVFDDPAVADNPFVLTLIARPDLLSNTTDDDLNFFNPLWQADRDFGITFMSFDPFVDFTDVLANGGFINGFAAFSFLATGGSAPPVPAVPEPATLAIWGAALGLIAWRNRKVLGKVA
jgi:hypothetical protein